MLSAQQQQDFQSKGYFVRDRLFSGDEMALLKQESQAIVAKFYPDSIRAVFSTQDQSKTRDDYFLQSADKIRCFFKVTSLTTD